MKNRLMKVARTVLLMPLHVAWIISLVVFAPLAVLAGTLGEGLNCPSLEWTTGGTPSYDGENVNWSYCSDDSYSDGACVVSGAGGWGDATSWIKATVAGPCKISFRYKVQTYNGTFKVMDGSTTLYEYTGVTGTSPSWQYKEFDLAAGSHEIKIQYRHPGMGYAYQFNGVKVDEFTVTANATLASALDAADLAFTTGGNADWFPQTSVTHDGEDAVRSGAISGSQSTWMQTTVTGPKQIRFWWKTSSEANYDVLRFYVDGTEKASVSGTTDWSQQTVQVTGTGTHTLKWQYSKDGSADSGDDCGWVDQVTVSESTSANNLFANGNFSKGDSDWYSSLDWIAIGGSLEIHSWSTYSDVQPSCPSYMESSRYVCELQSDAYSTVYQAVTIPAGACYEISCMHGGREIDDTADNSTVNYEQVMSIGCIWADSDTALTHDNFKLNALSLVKLSGAGSVDGVLAKVNSDQWQHIGTTIVNNSASDRIAYIGFSAVSGGMPGWGNLVAYAYVGTPVNQLAETYYVNGTTGNDSNTGLSASTAKKTIQAAIDAAPDGSTILVSAGIYSPITTENRRLTIIGEEGAAGSFINGCGTARCANLGSEQGETNTVVRGFTFCNGSANIRGGGVCCGTLYDCVITNCSACGFYELGGGGAWGVHAIGCEFVDNNATHAGGIGCGVAERCKFLRNTAQDDGGAAHSSLLKNCLVVGNRSNNCGGRGSGAAGANVTNFNCTFIGNYGCSGKLCTGILDSLPPERLKAAG